MIERTPLTPSVKVLRIITRLNVGGPARHVFILDRGLRHAGFDTMLAYGVTGADEASLEPLITGSALPARRIAGLSRQINLFGDLRAFSGLVRLMFTLRPDVVHTHTAKAGALGRLAARLFNLFQPRRRRCLVVHTFHGHVLREYFGRAGSFLVRLIERCLGSMTECLLVLSPQQRDDINIRYRVGRADRIRIVPLGLDLGSLMALPGAGTCGVRQDVTFAYVGRFVPIKNLPLLFEAFTEAHRQVPYTRLLMVGDGEVRSFLERQIAACGLQGVVELAGWQDDLVDVYRRIDVLVLASRSEGTPVAVLEAMAAGLPVVATAVGGVPDVIAHDETGLLVPSGAPGELAAAMIRLARNPGDRQRLGAAARRAIGTRYSAERLVCDVASLYRTELARIRAASGH